MKSLILFLFCFFSFNLLAQVQKLAIIKSIDETYFAPTYLDATEVALPSAHHFTLLQKINSFRFTPMTDASVMDVFNELISHPRARMKTPKGHCSQRRAYIQKQLKKMNITSGRILVKCPAKNGRLRVRDQVSGRNYTYSNYHDANIVTVRKNARTEFRVLDLQFQDTPITLHQYLSEIERFQKIRPAINKSASKGYCYWHVTTPYFSY